MFGILSLQLETTPAHGNNYFRRSNLEYESQYFCIGKNS
jgi:hypothetical protein